jgi:mono/diheme cytochrome c family protein
MTCRSKPGMGAIVRAFVAFGALSILTAIGGCGGGSSAPKNASPGLQVFDQASCGSCHTLAAAHSSGTAGPKLDGRSLDPAAVERIVRNGASGMPPFKDQLSDKQIQQVTDFVARSSQATQ